MCFYISDYTHICEYTIYRRMLYKLQKGQEKPTSNGAKIERASNFQQRPVWVSQDLNIITNSWTLLLHK